MGHYPPASDIKSFGVLQANPRSAVPTHLYLYLSKATADGVSKSCVHGAPRLWVNRSCGDLQASICRGLNCHH